MPISPVLRLALPVAALLALPACDTNPFDPSQVPVLAVTSSTPPVFSWTPAGAVLFRVYEGPSTRDGLAPIVWSVAAQTTRRNDLLGPISYGTIPAGAREDVPAQALVGGRTYTAELVRADPKGRGEGFSNTSNRYRDTLVFVAP